MTTSKLPSLIGIRSILKGWFNKAWQVTITGSRLLPVAGPLFLQFLSAFLTQGTVSSISIIFSWGGSISPEGFLSSVLLWLVIIVAVVGVGVTVVVVVVESSSVSDGKTRLPSSGLQFRDSISLSQLLDIQTQSSVQLLRENTNSVLSNQQMRPIAPSVPLKLIGWQLMNSLKLHCLATGASLGLVVLSVFSMLAACASKAAELLSAN
ncbi:hypothetical protein Tco_1465738 [Tanacetum coccineum]